MYASGNKVEVEGINIWLDDDKLNLLLLLPLTPFNLLNYIGMIRRDNKNLIKTWKFFS